MASNTVEKRGDKMRGSVAVALMLLLTIGALAYFMPRESKFGYEYELYRPWRYAPLIATYDFPIYKTAEELQAERDSATKNFLPFFCWTPDAGKNQLKAFEQARRTDALRSVPPAYAVHVAKLLNQVYERGIVSNEAMTELTRNNLKGVRIISGTEAVQRGADDIFTTRSAYEYIMSADTAHFAREILTRFNINSYLSPNLACDTAKTNAAFSDLLAAVAPASGMVQSGQRIIDRGEIVSPEQYKILQSFERESNRRSSPSEGLWSTIFGQMLFVTLLSLAFVGYLKLFRRDYLASPHSIFLMFCLIAVFPLLTYALMKHMFYSVYMVPYVIVPMFVRVFMDSRTAFLSAVVTLLLSSIALHAPYEFLCVEMMGSLVAIYALRELTERSQLMRVALAVTVVQLATMMACELAQGIDFSMLDVSTYIYIVIGGVLQLFAYPLLYLIEKTFGFTSGVTLVELTNTNNSILRRMSKVAQGTFIHSLQVANLAAEVADKIGAKPQLVRAGALYHDIGKMRNPAFFTENQSGVNPHDSLDEESSARIIISHVTEGLKLADKYHLPTVIRDFISTHHGKGRTKYFYIRWQNSHEGQTPPDAFDYPGPNPFTREQAILMMCDAVEASSRSLKEYSEENIKALVEKIIDAQVAEGCFRQCPITFRDIEDAKKVLTDSLKTIYHTRIAYPELKQGETPEPRPHTTLFGTGLHRTWRK